MTSGTDSNWHAHPSRTAAEDDPACSISDKSLRSLVQRGRQLHSPPLPPAAIPSTAHLPFSTFLLPSTHPPRRPGTLIHRLAIPSYNMPAAASAGLHLDHHHHHHHHSSISMPSSTHRLSALSDSFYGQAQYSSQYQAQFARDSQQYPAQQVAYYPPMPDRVYPPSSLSLSFPAQFPPATVVHNQFIPPQHHYSAPAGTGTRVGSSAVPQLSVSVNITPPPPQVAHKVWILDCKSCGSFLTNRGMKVRSPGPSHPPFSQPKSVHLYSVN